MGWFFRLIDKEVYHKSVMEAFFCCDVWAHVTSSLQILQINMDRYVWIKEETMFFLYIYFLTSNEKEKYNNHL